MPCRGGVDGTAVQAMHGPEHAGPGGACILCVLVYNSHPFPPSFCWVTSCMRAAAGRAGCAGAQQTAAGALLGRAGGRCCSGGGCGRQHSPHAARVASTSVEASPSCSVSLHVTELQKSACYWVAFSHPRCPKCTECLVQTPSKATEAAAWLMCGGSCAVAAL